MKKWDYIKLEREFEFLDTKFEVTYHQFAGLIEIRELIRLTWWQRLFRTDGQDRIWKTLYFGHVTPLKKAIEIYNTGLNLTKNDIE